MFADTDLNVWPTASKYNRSVYLPNLSALGISNERAYLVQQGGAYCGAGTLLSLHRIACLLPR
ncbi:hypothetical protein D3C80_805090 [compost metagenome]